MLCFAAVSLGSVHFLSRARGVRHWLSIAGLSLVFSLSRVDLLATYSVSYFSRYWRDRRWQDLATGLALNCLGAVALLFLKRLYPIGYAPGDKPFQLWTNLTHADVLIAGAFLCPFVVATSAGWRRKSWREILADDINLLAGWFAAELLLCLAFGRPREIRLFFPFSGLLAVLAINALLPRGFALWEDSAAPCE
jgi:hypothetical protein